MGLLEFKEFTGKSSRKVGLVDRIFRSNLPGRYAGYHL